MAALIGSPGGSRARDALSASTGRPRATAAVSRSGGSDPVGAADTVALEERGVVLAPGRSSAASTPGGSPFSRNSCFSRRGGRWRWPGSGQRRCGTGLASVRDCRASPGGIGSAGRAVGRPPDGQMSDDRRSGSPAGSEGTEYRLRRMSCRSRRSCSASGSINAPALPPAKAPWPLEGRSGCTRGDGHSSCATAKHRPAFSRAFRRRRRDCTSRQVREVSPLALLRIRAPRKCRTAG
jgi:hypothetical protein